MAYTFGMVAFEQDIAIYMSTLILSVLGLPILYLMAIPMDPAEQVALDEAYDIDVVRRLWQFASCSLERRRCMVSCRGWWYKKLNTASECSVLAKIAICAASPEHRRVLRKVGRCV